MALVGAFVLVNLATRAQAIHAAAGGGVAARAGLVVVGLVTAACLARPALTASALQLFGASFFLYGFHSYRPQSQVFELGVTAFALVLLVRLVQQMVASILSKKVAAGSTRLVVDMPVGPSAKIRDPRSALRMRKLFEHVAAAMGIAIAVVVTDGSQPVGRGVGPVLEMRDVLAVLDGRADAPQDLAEKSVALAGRVLEADPGLRGGAGEARARELLASGAARAKLDEIGESQGPPPVKAELGDLVHEIKARKAGWMDSVDCLQIARIARLAGAPTDPGAGMIRTKWWNCRSVPIICAPT